MIILLRCRDLWDCCYVTCCFALWDCCYDLDAETPGLKKDEKGSCTFFYQKPTRNANLAKFSRENLAKFCLSKFVFRCSENDILFENVRFASAVSGPPGCFCFVLFHMFFWERTTVGGGVVKVLILHFFEIWKWFAHEATNHDCPGPGYYIFYRDVVSFQECFIFCLAL